MIVAARSRDPMTRWPTSWQVLEQLAECVDGVTEPMLERQGFPMVTLRLLEADGFARSERRNPRGFAVTRWFITATGKAAIKRRKS